MIDRPKTGLPVPAYDQAATAREAAATAAFNKIFIEYPPQRAILERIEALRLKTLGRRGVPLPGLRLSQVTSAGKSKILTRYRDELARSTAAGKASNPHQVVYISLRKRVSIKMVFQRLLQILGDPHCELGTVEVLIMRAEKFLKARQVELLIVDEVQHLAHPNKDNDDVTDELKSFMDSGHVPVVLCGNEDSEAFFTRNAQLASRLGVPLELTPVSKRTIPEARLFKTFCVELDHALVDVGATRAGSSLGQAAVLDPMLEASGGHIGRVCRIVQHALEHSARRDADYIEIADLAAAVRGFAIPAGYVARNPFEPYA